MYLISDNVDTLTGMRLAGVDGVVVHEKEELRNAIETAMEDPDVGIVLLTERFGREFPELIDEIKLKRTMPLLIEIPDRHGTGRKKDVYKRQIIHCAFLIRRYGQLFAN